MITHSTCYEDSVAFDLLIHKQAGGSLNIKMSSNQYRDPHIKDKTVLSLTWESPYLEKTVIILRWGPDFLLPIILESHMARYDRASGMYYVV